MSRHHQRGGVGQAVAMSAGAWERSVDNAVARLWNAQQAAAQRWAKRTAAAAASRGWGAWAFPCLAVGSLGAAAGFILLVVAGLFAMAPFALGVGASKLAASAAERLGGPVGNAVRQGAVLAAGIFKLMGVVAFQAVAGLVSTLSLRAVFSGMEDAAVRLWTARPDLAPRHARALGINIFCFQSTKSCHGMDDGLDRLRALGYGSLCDASLSIWANKPSGPWAFVSSGVRPWESPIQRVDRVLSAEFMGTTSAERCWINWAKAMGERGAVEEALATESMPLSKRARRL